MIPADEIRALFGLDGPDAEGRADRQMSMAHKIVEPVVTRHLAEGSMILDQTPMLAPTGGAEE